MTLLGLFAGTCTTLSFLPQVIRTLRTRHAGDLSIVWLLTFAVGIGSWCVYGVLKSDITIILSNAVTLGLVLSLTVAKYTIKPPPEAAPDETF